MRRPWLAWTMPHPTGTGAWRRFEDIQCVAWSFKGRRHEVRHPQDMADQAEVARDMMKEEPYKRSMSFFHAFLSVFSLIST